MDLVVDAIRQRTNKPLKQVIIQESGGTLKAIDKAAAKGLMHKNNAAHKKSALTLKLNKIG